MRRGAQIIRVLFWLLTLVGFAARAQYSVNAVGYVQVVFPAGYTFCANPLRTTNDIVSVEIPTAPESAAVYSWDVSQQRFAAPSVYHNGWSTNTSLPVGKGFVVYTPVPFTNVFVGEVLQGSLTNAIAGSNQLSLVSSLVPQMASLNDLNFPATDGDTVYMPIAATQKLSDAYNYFAGYGWFNSVGSVGTNGPVLPVCGAFFVQHAGADTNWVRTFYVNNLNSKPNVPVKVNQVSKQFMTLAVNNPSGSAYNVEFSTDRTIWKTIATNQITATFTANISGNKTGFFRVRPTL